MALYGNGYISGGITWAGNTTTLTMPATITATGWIAEAAKPKKKTAIDWLNEQVEAMCSVAREALPA